MCIGTCVLADFPSSSDNQFFDVATFKGSWGNEGCTFRGNITFCKTSNILEEDTVLIEFGAIADNFC